MLLPSVVFSSAAKKCVVLIETPDRDPCIALYDVVDDGNSLLANRREILFLFDAVPFYSPLALSSDGSILSLESDSVGFISMLSGDSWWSRDNEEENNLLAIQFSPNDAFVALAFRDALSIKYGFLRMLGGPNGDSLWELAEDDTGVRLPVIDTLAFCPSSTRLACICGDGPCGQIGVRANAVFIVDLPFGLSRRLILDDIVTAVTFHPCGLRLLVVHVTSICIIDILSGVRLHSAPLIDPIRELLAVSWPDESNGDH